MPAHVATRHPDPDPAALLAAYDDRLRAHVSARLPAGVLVDRDGPLVRYSGFSWGGMVVYRDLGGLVGDALDELIARQVHHFAERGERFEWKLHGHDRPADLSDRLAAAGFRVGAPETVVIGQVARMAGTPVLPQGVALRQVTSRVDLEQIDVVEGAVWGEDGSGYGTMLEAELEADPDGLVVVVAEAAETVVCAAWVRFETGTGFATLWGGATLPAWRGQGIYRATVAHRARVAAERGFEYLEVDASDDSRPILERLGFVAVTTTTPHSWRPPADPAE
ncbi:MAG TPA: GNAT family N-acetyltransferase [Candidatus Deferrimicrobiaceae bacterium]|nr:GNAT family N-acetyltransferase [Candidatus Deferrimicrobiaceae bacterium]